MMTLTSHSGVSSPHLDAVWPKQKVLIPRCLLSPPAPNPAVTLHCGTLQVLALPQLDSVHLVMVGRHLHAYLSLPCLV